MIRKICMFCHRSHKQKPKLCKAKGDIMTRYIEAGLEVFQVLAGIHNGLIKLNAEALELVDKRNKSEKRRHK